MKLTNSKEDKLAKAIWALAEKYPIEKLEPLVNKITQTHLQYIKNFIANLKNNNEVQS